jgi:hypothetical protein
MRNPTTRGATGETVDSNALAPRGQEKPDRLLAQTGVLQRSHPEAIVSTRGWRRYGELFLRLSFTEAITLTMTIVRGLTAVIV